MKKVLFGCLGVLVVAAIVTGAAGYYFVYRPARSFFAGMTQLQEFPRLNAQIRNTQLFSAPADGVLTETMVQRFAHAQQAVHDAMGARLKELDAKYEVLNEQNGGKPSFSDGIAALKDLAGIIVEAKRAQVSALNANGFSLAEYDWVRKSVYAASGIPMSVNFEHIVEQASKGQIATGDSVAEAVTGHIPERNRELVAPHAEMLKENAALAFFGL
jgi:hypothetical protein